MYPNKMHKHPLRFTMIHEDDVQDAQEKDNKSKRKEKTRKGEKRKEKREKERTQIKIDSDSAVARFLLSLTAVIRFLCF